MTAGDADDGALVDLLAQLGEASKNPPSFSPEEIAAYEEEAKAAIAASRERVRKAEARRFGLIPARVADHWPRDEQPRDVVEPDLSGRPMPGLAVLAALRLFALGRSERGVEEELQKSGKKLSWRRVRRVWSWHASEAARWDLGQGTVIFEPGYDFVASGPPEWRMVRLVRFGPVRSDLSQST